MSTRELNPISSSLTDSQARESAEIAGVCSDGKKCGVPPAVGDDAYCVACPNQHKDDLDRITAAIQEGRSHVELTTASGSAEKQPRYQDAKGDDWIDEFARTATADEFRGAMRFTIGKYLRRAGKKDPLPSEIRKMRDYCQRWEAYELSLGDEQ